MRAILCLAVLGAIGCGERGGGGGGVLGDGGPRADVPCALRCAPPPAGCEYIPPPAGECSCGTLDCVDAGCGAVECPAPPMGCRYTPDPIDPCSCGVLTCEEAVCCGSSCDPPSFPTFGRECTSDSGCFVALHQSDCCGTYAALGLAASERSRFEASEATCASMYPACGCAARPTVADDGTMCFDSPVVVRCLDGLCSTTCGI